MVSHLDSFHQLNHMAHASINAQEKIISSSPSLTLWRSMKAFIMPKHPGHILQGFNNISTIREKTHCKRRNTSYPWFFLSTLWQTSFVGKSLHSFPYSTRSSMTIAFHLWTKYLRDTSTLLSYILSFHAFLSTRQWANERYTLKCSSKMKCFHYINTWCIYFAKVMATSSTNKSAVSTANGKCIWQKQEATLFVTEIK